MVKKYLCSLLLLLNLGFGDEVYAIFSVMSVKDSRLTLDSSGIVDSITVEVGSAVKKGDVLLNLENEDRKQNLSIHTAQNEGYKQQYLFAKKQYERFQRSGSAIDKNTIEQNFSTYKQLESAYLSSNYSVAYNKALLEKTILKAPFDGVIAGKNIELGDGVTQNATVLFRLISNEKKLVIEFDSKYGSMVKVGDVFRYRVDGSGELREAEIYKIYPAIDVRTRRLTAEANAPDSFQPGLFGDGYIITR